jgi:hypothetical protein
MKNKIKKINTKGVEVNYFENNKNDYISLTDIARYKNPDEPKVVVQNWMRNYATIEFLGVWEQINNPSFKGLEFDTFKSSSGSNSFTLSPQKWIENTNAIGIISKSGNGGGTFAHRDIAFEFASWVSAEFKLYLITEFQRLKIDENERDQLGWDAKRSLTKINYRIHTDAIKQNLIIDKNLEIKDQSDIYASEADMLNVVIFGTTAKIWKSANKDKVGNMRDYSNVMDLVLLANAETLNAEFIRNELNIKVRYLKLLKIVESQRKLLANNSSVKKLENKK